MREEGGDGDSIEEPQGPRSTVPSSCPGSTPRTLPEQERRVAQPKGMGGRNGRLGIRHTGVRAPPLHPR